MMAHSSNISKDSFVSNLLVQCILVFMDICYIFHTDFVHLILAFFLTTLAFLLCFSVARYEKKARYTPRFLSDLVLKSGTIMKASGKVAVVLGGARGIGRACVESLLQNGAKVSDQNETLILSHSKYGNIINLEANIIDLVHICNYFPGDNG